jgi:hypothetical protein
VDLTFIQALYFNTVLLIYYTITPCITKWGDNYSKVLSFLMRLHIHQISMKHIYNQESMYNSDKNPGAIK